MATVYPQFTARKVLVSEWIEGDKLVESSAADVRAACTTILNCYLVQLLETGIMHADPHPGNLLRAPDGKIVSRTKVPRLVRPTTMDGSACLASAMQPTLFSGPCKSSGSNRRPLLPSSSAHAGVVAHAAEARPSYRVFKYLCALKFCPFPGHFGLWVGDGGERVPTHCAGRVHRAPVHGGLGCHQSRPHQSW